MDSKNLSMEGRRYAGCGTMAVIAVNGGFFRTGVCLLCCLNHKNYHPNQQHIYSMFYCFYLYTVLYKNEKDSEYPLWDPSPFHQ